MSEDLALFRQFHARKTDPQTSHEAARSMRSGSAVQCDAIERVLVETCGLLTGEEIAERCGLTMVQVCRRLPDLQKQGRARPTDVTRPTSTGRQARCWGAVALVPSGDAA